MAQKTYWHLLEAKRMPTDYELLTSKLLYYPGRGFEVTTPLSVWYEEHQVRSPLTAESIASFRDPEGLTYTSYTASRAAREAYVDGLFASIEERGCDAELAGSWVTVLGRTLAVLRFPFHGFQMIASYVGQMAPSGRVAVAALFQAGDEVRRVQRMAYRIAALRAARPAAGGEAEIGADSRSRWEGAPEWQPLREAVERLLVAYDWGEAFAGLCLCLKPAIDDLFLVRFAALARRSGDPLLAEILRSLDEDARWHRAWAEALVRAAREAPGAFEALQRWVDRWAPVAGRAAAACAEAFDAESGAAAIGAQTAYLARMGLSPPAALDGAPHEG